MALTPHSNYILKRNPREGLEVIDGIAIIRDIQAISSSSLGGQAIVVPVGSFTGNNAPPIAALSGLMPDTQFMVYGGGILLDHSLGDYTFAGITITVPTGATTLRVVIL